MATSERHGERSRLRTARCSPALRDAGASRGRPTRGSAAKNSEQSSEQSSRSTSSSSFNFLPSFFLSSFFFFIFFLPDLLSHFYQNRNALLSKREHFFFMIEVNQNFYHRSISDRSCPWFLSHHGKLIEIMGSFYQNRTSYYKSLIKNLNIPFW